MFSEIMIKEKLGLILLSTLLASLAFMRLYGISLSRPGQVKFSFYKVLSIKI